MSFDIDLQEVDGRSPTLSLQISISVVMGTWISLNTKPLAHGAPRLCY